MEDVQHVFLVGAKGIGAYGGYETFVNKLTEYHRDNANIRYHVACKANGDGYMDETRLEGVTRISDTEFYYHNAHCFKISVPEKLGPVQAIYYDMMALKKCCEIIRRENIRNPIVYIMACRIGPFLENFYRQIHKLGGKIYLNPDGHEWLRAKWSAPVRKYWKISERLMVKYSDLVICDSINIEKYIHESYDGKGIGGANPNTTFIAYGAETRKSQLEDTDPKFVNWLQEKGLEKNEYYLVVGRFVPENNYETMIREFMKSNSKKSFALITGTNEKFLMQLEEKLHFKADSRIKFVGTVYDQELLMKIRENAYGYFHGHEVGGTNPSLLEALGSTRLNLLLNVGFNQEVAEDAAIYWSKEEGSLANLIDQADMFAQETIDALGMKAKARIKSAYSWSFISGRYAEVFLKEKFNIAMFGQKRVPSREGGVEIVVEELAVRMVEQGHKVTCYNRQSNDAYYGGTDALALERCKGIQIHTMPTLQKKGFAALTASFFAALKCAFGRYDVVHIHAEGPAFFSFLLKWFGKRVIVTIHGLDWQREKWKNGIASHFIRMGEQNAVRWADEIIVLSEAVRDYFQNTYGRKTVFIPNGISRPQLRTPQQIWTKYGLAGQDYILFLGRLVPEKGLRYLINAYKNVKTDKKLVIAGGSSDTEGFQKDLHEMAADDDRILFTGFVKGALLDELYSNAYVYTLPSDLEGMPLSLLEAMSYGNCCLVSDIPECADVVEDKGILFRKSNVEDLCKQLQRLCDDENLVQTYKVQAADFICGKYNWDDVVEQTLELYQ